MVMLAALAPRELFYWMLAIGAGCLVLAVVAVAFLAGVSKFAPNATGGSLRSATTFMAVLVGIIVLTIMFFLLVQETANTRNFENAMKAAALIIAPLGTFIGFVAGQSAGTASAEKATELATQAQEIGKKANDAASDLRQKLDEANARENLLRGSMDPSTLDAIMQAHPRTFNLLRD